MKINGANIGIKGLNGYVKCTKPGPGPVPNMLAAFHIDKTMLICWER